MSASDVIIGLGGNLGSRRRNLQSAVEKIAALRGFQVTAVSSLFETKAWGGPSGQRNYFNAALRGRSQGISPRQLLKMLQAIEVEGGRERHVLNGPRTLDLDLLLCGSSIVESDALTLPHPRMLDRAFVMAPVSEIAGELTHPLFATSLGQLARKLGREGILSVVSCDEWLGLGATPQP